MTRKTQYLWMSVGAVLCLLGIGFALKIRDASKVVASSEPQVTQTTVTAQKEDVTAAPPVKNAEPPKLKEQDEVGTIPLGLGSATLPLMPPSQAMDVKDTSPAQRQAQRPRTGKRRTAGTRAAVARRRRADHGDTAADARPGEHDHADSDRGVGASARPSQGDLEQPAAVWSRSRAAAAVGDYPGQRNREDRICRRRTAVGRHHRPVAGLRGARHGRNRSGNLAATLGTSERWVEIHALNPGMKSTALLARERYVRLPADACLTLTEEVESIKPLPAMRPSRRRTM